MFKTNFTRAIRTALFAAITFSSGYVGASAADGKVEPGVFKLSISPWLGYGMWYIAEDKGYFKANGLEGVELTNFSDSKDLLAAIARGDLDGQNLSIQRLVQNVEKGFPMKAVLLLDASTKADAVLAGKDIKSVADLKGKTVAFEQGTTSDLLLNYLLDRDGISIKDVTVSEMTADSAGTAMIAGSVAAAVTYEPYISAALSADKDLKVIGEAGEAPGLISDVLAVSDATLKSKPGQVEAMVKSWDQAVSFYRANVTEGRTIIAKHVGADPKSLESAFDGVSYYSLSESRTALQGQFKTETYPQIIKAATSAKMIDKNVTFESVVEPSLR